MSDLNLPPHLNEVLDIMSREMGVPREALVAQAVYQLARLNGYVVPGKVSGMAPATQSAASSARPGAATPVPAPAPMKPAPAAAPAASAIKRRPPEPEPVPEEPSPSEDEEGNPFEEQEEDAAPSGEEPLEDEPAVDEEPEHEDEPPPDEEPEQEEEEPAPPPSKGRGGPTMVISMVGREPYKMTGDQVMLGRGKHCDFVIESNRCSREHARFTRKGNDFFVEDLGSSNGTFVGAGSKEKLTAPRKLKDGDDVTFGTEKVKVAIKK